MKATLVGTHLTSAETFNLALPQLEAFCLAQAELRARWAFARVDETFSIHQHLLDEASIERVLATEPDLLGLSCHCWDVDALAALAGRVRAARPKVRIVAGGPSVTNAGIDFLRDHPSIDALVLGDGELPFADILRRWDAGLGGIPGVAHRAPDGALVPEPGDAAPLALDDIPSPYLTGCARPAVHELLLSFQRGCFFRCRYCAWRLGSGRVLFASGERMQAEIRWAREQGYARVFVVDAAMNAAPRHLRAFADAVGAADPEGRLRFCYFLDLRALRDDDLPVLARIPTSHLEIGLNSISAAAIAHSGRKPGEIEDFADRFAAVAQIAPITLHLILGLPGDTLEGFRETLDFVATLADRVGEDRIRDVQVFWLVVPPGTEYWRDREALGLTVHAPGMPYVLGTRSFPLADMVEAVRMAQRHRVGHLCVFDGPEAQLEAARLEPFTFSFGLLTARPPDREDERPPSLVAPSGDPPRDDERVRAWVLGLVRPYGPGANLQRSWRVEAQVTGGRWPAVRLCSVETGEALLVEVAPRGTHPRTFASTDLHDVRWTSDGASPAPDGRRAARLASEIVDAVRRNEPRVPPMPEGSAPRTDAATEPDR